MRTHFSIRLPTSLGTDSTGLAMSPGRFRTAGFLITLHKSIQHFLSDSELALNIWPCTAFKKVEGAITPFPHLILTNLHALRLLPRHCEEKSRLFLLGSIYSHGCEKLRNTTLPLLLKTNQGFSRGLMAEPQYYKDFSLEAGVGFEPTFSDL